MRHQRLVSLFVLATCANFTIGCSAEDPGSGEPVAKARTALARPADATLWPSGIVPICWASTVTAHPRYVELTSRILEIVNDHFPRAANIHFEDAGPCIANPRGVIMVNESSTGGGDVDFPLGYRNDAPTVMNLDFDSSTWFSTQTRIQQIIMHEFAHALGFEHEFRRPDFACANEAANEPDLLPGWDDHGTSPDGDSITVSTYCTQRTVLSAGDVSGLQDAYGAPGKLQIHAMATDSGLDAMSHRWDGTSWQWQELFANQDDLRTRPALASIRTGATEILRSFSMSGTGLLADTWNGSIWRFQKWTNKVIDLAPAPVAYRDYDPLGSFSESKVKWHVFTRTGSPNFGTLLSNHFDGSSWSWQDHGKPAGGNVVDASAITFRDHAANFTYIYAFVRAANNELYVRHGLNIPNTWSGLGKPSAGTPGPIASTTFRECLFGSCTASATRQIHVWTVSNGTLWNLWWDGTQWIWGDLGAPAGTTLASERPSPITWTELGRRRHSVFVRDAQSNLRELYWNGGSWSWVNHSKPAGVTAMTAPSASFWRNPQLPADPNAVTTTYPARYVFVIGNNDKAYVRYTPDGTNWDWSDQTTPYGNLPLHQPRGISATAYWNR